MLDDSYFMKQALIEAVKAGERGEVPVGAVVVCKERIIARAHNLTETLNDVTAQAIAPAHITQGSTVTYKVHSFRYFPPRTLAAAVMACISAWAVTSFSVSVRLCARAMIRCQCSWWEISE